MRVGPAKGTSTLLDAPCVSGMVMRVGPPKGTFTLLDAPCVSAVDANGDMVMRVGPAKGTSTLLDAPCVSLVARSTLPRLGLVAGSPAKVTELYSPPRVTVTLPGWG